MNKQELAKIMAKMNIIIAAMEELGSNRLKQKIGEALEAKGYSQDRAIKAVEIVEDHITEREVAEELVKQLSTYMESAVITLVDFVERSQK